MSRAPESRGSRDSAYGQAPDLPASGVDHLVAAVGMCRRSATRRRWMWAAILLLATAATAAAWYGGYVPRLALAFPGGLFVAYVIAALASAPARTAQRRRVLLSAEHADSRARMGERPQRASAASRSQDAWDPRDANIPSSVVESSTERVSRDSRRPAQPAARVGRRTGMAPDLLESAQAARSQRRSPSRVAFEADERGDDTASVPAIRGYVDGLRRAANDS